VDARPARTDELHHLDAWPGSTDWHETFRLEFAADDASIAGYVLVVLRPSESRSWFWACVAGRDRRLVLVEENDAPLPRRELVELRAPGLWTDIECEDAGEHVSVGLEAFGLRVDDPQESISARRGERTPVGFDLEWETEEPVTRHGTHGYAMACRVSGEVLVGDEQHALDVSGARAHWWGEPSWWRTPDPSPPPDDATVRVPVSIPDREVASRVLWSTIAVDGDRSREERARASWRHTVV
jgi:hypothetical protein